MEMNIKFTNSIKILQNKTARSLQLNKLMLLLDISVTLFKSPVKIGPAVSENTWNKRGLAD